MQNTSIADWKNCDLSDSQNSVIAPIQKALSIDLNEFTILVDIFKD
ncbi:hypothetical protein [Gilliamella sp. Bif1-4]|nr:hypothetical protein [Gilliamella apicola]